MVEEEDLLVDNSRSFLEWQDRRGVKFLATVIESFMERERENEGNFSASFLKACGVTQGVCQTLKLGCLFSS